MSAADQIPEMTDADLARFHANTAQVHEIGSGPRFAQAATLLPLLEAEMAARAAARPPTKLAQAKAARAAKAVEAAKTADAEKPVKARKSVKAAKEPAEAEA